MSGCCVARSQTEEATFTRLSFSRPSVSDDNPFSEALFRTLKYRPGYQCFAEALKWVEGFVVARSTPDLFQCSIDV